MFGFGQVIIYQGNSLPEVTKVKEVLNQHQIPYTYDVFDRGGEFMGIGRDPARAHFGSAGMNKTCLKQYTLKVKKADAEKARYILSGRD